MAESRESIISDIVKDMGAFRRSMFGRPKLAGKLMLKKAHSLISPAQGELLHILKTRDSLTVKETAEMMGVTGSAVTQLVDPLVRAGLVTREHDENDRRSVRVSIAAKGREKMTIFERHHKRHLTVLLEPLTVEELRTYRDLHRKIVNNLHADEGERGDYAG
ncbi:MAG: MarR family transcriptional regulator [Actinomycetota bacterium]